MNVRLWCFAAALLPVILLSAQQPAPQDPRQPAAQDPPPQPDRPAFRQPSPEAMRQIAERWQRMSDHANAINDAASHIQSLDDARKLVSLVADEFAKELPPKWATHSIREHIARAEYETAADPGALIPDQHIADIWNDFVEKIGAPDETRLNAAEIHYMRDAQYTSARMGWQYSRNIWTVPGVFALGPDGKVANGSRALEAIRLLWQLGNRTDDFNGVHEAAQKGVLLSDLFAPSEKSTASGQGRVSISAGKQRSFSGFATARAVQFPVQQAAIRYQRDHGQHAMNQAIEALLKELLAE